MPLWASHRGMAADVSNMVWECDVLLQGASTIRVKGFMVAMLGIGVRRVELSRRQHAAVSTPPPLRGVALRFGWGSRIRIEAAVAAAAAAAAAGGGGQQAAAAASVDKIPVSSCHTGTHTVVSHVITFLLTCAASRSRTAVNNCQRKSFGHSIIILSGCSTHPQFRSSVQAAPLMADLSLSIKLAAGPKPHRINTNVIDSPPKLDTYINIAIYVHTYILSHCRSIFCCITLPYRTVHSWQQFFQA